MKDALAEHSRAWPELSRRRTNASAARSVWNVLFVEFVFCCCTFLKGEALTFPGMGPVDILPFVLELENFYSYWLQL